MVGEDWSSKEGNGCMSELRGGQNLGNGRRERSQQNGKKEWFVILWQNQKSKSKVMEDDRRFQGKNYTARRISNTGQHLRKLLHLDNEAQVP